MQQRGIQLTTRRLIQRLEPLRDHRDHLLGRLLTEASAP
jgi:hypothetical protein